MPGTQKFFSALSKKELDDWQQSNIFRTALNTLEAKQFFKTKEAVEDFVYYSKKVGFSPPYSHILEIDVFKKCLKVLKIHESLLDTFDAITIYEVDLPNFTKCTKFVKDYAI